MSRPCPLCNSIAHTLLRPMRYALFDDSSLPAQTAIVRCAACRFLYASSDATARDYLAHYQQNSIYAAGHVTAAGGGADETGPLAVRAQRFLSQVKPNGTVVDVGAGSGGLVAIIRGLRPDVRCVAIDPDPTCVQLLHAMGWEAHHGTLEDLPASLLKQADAVILSHVLEHLWRPMEGVTQAAALLRPEGVLYIETPDRNGYPDHPNVPFYYFDPEHINHFSVSDLSRVGVPGNLHAIARQRSTLQLADGSSYPICWALLRQVTSASPTPVDQDNDALDSYLLREEARMQSWLRHAREALVTAQTGNGFILWGTGSQAQRTLAEGLFDGMTVRAVVDSDPAKQGRKITDHTVVAPAQGLKAAEGATVVILAARSATYSIKNMLRAQYPDRPSITLTLVQD